jgi:hypothetical protein
MFSTEVQHFAERSANPRVWQDFVFKVREYPRGWLSGFLFEIPAADGFPCGNPWVPQPVVIYKKDQTA